MNSKKMIIVVGALLIGGFVYAQQAFSDKLLIKERTLLKSSKGSIVKPIFIPLAPGVVQPMGWIKEQAFLASNGITGHLDEYSPVHNEGWRGRGFNAVGASSEDGTGWPLEQAGYWLDGAVRLAYILNDTTLINKVSARLDTVVDGVLNGGETFIYWKSKDFSKGDGFNSWSQSHIGRALVAYYRATGNQKVLDALNKVYGQFTIPILKNHFGSVTGAVNLDPMLQTYVMGGNEAVLDRISEAISNPKYIELMQAWSQGDIPVGHGVIIYENIRIPALTYQWSGNEQQLKATQQGLNLIEKNHLLPCGVASSEEWLAGIGSTRSIETCNIACAPVAYQQIMQVTGEGRYGDNIEKIFFNATPVVVSRDYKNATYYQSPNRIEGVFPCEFPGAPMDIEPIVEKRISSFDYRPNGHTVLCCVGNLTRALPNYIMNMWMGTLDNGLAATLYGPSSVNSVVGENNTAVSIISQTNYPFEEKITLKINPQQSVKFPLYLRIPNWCKNAKLTINGGEVKYSVDRGFAKIERDWSKNDRVELTFPMEIVIQEGEETSYPNHEYFKLDAEGKLCVLAKVENIHNPYQSVFYGPLLFALPIAELGLNKQDCNAEWRYALNVKNKETDIKIHFSKMPKNWIWGIDQSPITLSVRAKCFTWHPTIEQPLPENRVQEGRDESISLVPYGCTRFRISMFPIVK